MESTELSLEQRSCRDCLHGGGTGDRKFLSCGFYSSRRDLLRELPAAAVVYEGQGDNGGGCIILGAETAEACCRFTRKEATMEDRTGKGRRITASAIKKYDHELLSRCIGTFLSMGTPVDEIGRVLSDCPISLIEKAGFGLRIWSGAVGREIVLGKDISWQQVADLLRGGADADALDMIFTAMELFEGTLVDEVTEEDSGAPAAGADDEGGVFCLKN